MKNVVEAEIRLFVFVFNQLQWRMRIDPPPCLCQSLMGLCTWTMEHIDNRITWYAVPYLAGEYFYTSIKERKNYLYRQLACLVAYEQQTQTICVDPECLEISKSDCLPPEIIAQLSGKIEMD